MLTNYMGNRKNEFILGIIAGVIGIFISIGGLLLGFIGSSLGLGSGSIIVAAITAIVSIVGLIGAILVRKESKEKISTWTMIGVGIIGLIAAGFLYIVPALLFIIAGIMVLTRKT